MRVIQYHQNSTYDWNYRAYCGSKIFHHQKFLTYKRAFAWYRMSEMILMVQSVPPYPYIHACLFTFSGVMVCTPWVTFSTGNVFSLHEPFSKTSCRNSTCITIIQLFLISRNAFTIQDCKHEKGAPLSFISHMMKMGKVKKGFSPYSRCRRRGTPYRWNVEGVGVVLIQDYRTTAFNWFRFSPKVTLS